MNKLVSILTACTLATGLASCSSDNNDTPNNPDNPDNPADSKYFVSLGITANDVTTYYVVNAKDLMSGTITAKNQGLEQTGYRDFQQNGNVIYSIGGLGLTDCNGLIINKDGSISQKGNFVFNNRLDGFAPVDDNTMVGMELPKDAQSGDKLTFYTIDNNSVSITKTVKDTPVSPLNATDWPTLTGMCYNDNKVYVAYYPMNPTDFATPDVKNATIAVYSYPDFKFQKVMTDDRIGAAGSWNAYNALTKDEKGDIYVMSNTSMSNGFSQNGTAPTGFLRIPNGTTEFDPSYMFNFQEKSGGFRPAHIVYVGNGKALVEYSTIKTPTSEDRWGDKNLKCAVVDLYKQEFHDITDIPVHNGNGGRRFAAMAEGKYAYLSIPTADGLYFYRVDTDNYTAQKGAKIEASFVGGVFEAK